MSLGDDGSQESPFAQLPQAKGSWRGGAAVPKKKSRGWQRRVVKKTPTKTSNMRRMRILLLGAVLTALTVAFIRVVFPAPITVPLLVVTFQYDHLAIPPNAWAWEDATHLEKFQDENERVEPPIAVDGLNGFGRNIADCETPEKAINEIAAWVNSAHLGGLGKNTVLLYLSGHGVVDANANPCLLIGHSTPFQSDTWLSLSALLDKLHECQVANPRRKLVILLDSNRLGVHWSLGQLAANFGESLDQLLTARSVVADNIYLINSAGPGEVAWTAPEIQGTAFGHYVRRGLKGEADGSNPESKQDGTVTLQELQSYLSSAVSHWVTVNRLGSQRPRLWPAQAENFAIVTATSTRPASVPKFENHAVKVWENIDELWGFYDGLRTGEAPRLDPLKWQEFVQRLTALEEICMAGSPASPLLTKIDALMHEIRQLRRDLEAAKWPAPGSGWRSLALAASGGDTPPAPLSPVAQPPGNAAAADGPQLWKQLCEGTDDLALTDAMRKSLAQRPTVDYVELTFAKMLGEFAPQNVRGKGLSQMALQSRRLAEQAAAPADERATFAIRDLVSEADDLRRKAEDQFFVGEDAQCAEAQAAWKKTNLATPDPGSYQRASKLSQALAEALAARDQVLAGFPALAQWYVRHPLPHQHSDVSLDRLVDDLQELERLLPTGWQTGDVDIGKLGQATGRLSEAYDRLQEVFGESCNLTNQQDDTHRFAALQSVLRFPALMGSNRQDLRGDYFQFLEMRSTDDKFASGTGLSAIADTENAAITASITPERVVSLLRGIDRDAVTDAGKGGTAPGSKANAETTKQNPEILLQQAANAGEQVRQLLAGLRERVTRQVTASHDAAKTEASAAEIRRRAADAERAARAGCSLSWLGEWNKLDPVQELRKLDFHQLAVWQAARTIDDFWGPGRQRGPSYFAAVAAEYLQFAESLLPGARDAQQQGERRRQYEAAQKLELEGKSISAEPGQLVAQNITLQTSPEMPHGMAALYWEFGNNEDVQSVEIQSGNKGGGEVRQTARRFDVQVPRQTLSWPYSVKVMPGMLGGELTANLYYRNRLQQDAITVRSNEGPEIAFTPAVHRSATIMVRGKDRQPCSVMFVIDCSASMDKPDGSGTKRMEAARRAFEKILGHLQKRPKGEFRVGVILYGHRVGTDPKLGQIVYRQAKWGEGGNAPDAPVKRERDAEMVMPLGIIEAEPLGEVSHALELQDDRGHPWDGYGHTPLNYAILLAAKELGKESSALQRKLIVLTDGDNTEKTEDSTPGKVADAVFDRKIDLTIIGFGLEKPNADLQRIVDRNSISKDKRVFVPASRQSDLLNEFLKSLDLAEFFVKSPEIKSEQGKFGPEVLGKPIVVPAQPQGSDYLVAIDRRADIDAARCQMFGAEAVELELSLRNAKPRLEYKAALEDLTPVADVGPYHLRLARPAREGRVIKFQTSWQLQDLTQLARPPAELWGEITPLSSDSGSPPAGPPFVFCDVDLLINQASPVLEMKLPIGQQTTDTQVPHWPPATNWANVTVYFKMSKSQPDSWTVAQVMSGQGSMDKPWKCRIENEVEFHTKVDETSPHIIDVFEEFKGTGTPPRLIVNMSTDTGQPPHRILRKYGHQRARHRFVFDAAQTDAVRVKQFAINIVKVTEPLSNSASGETGFLKFSHPIRVEAVKAVAP